MYNNPNDITYEGGWIPEVVVTGRRPWRIDTDPTNFGYRPGIRDQALGGLGNLVTGMILGSAVPTMVESFIPLGSYRPSTRTYNSFDPINSRLYRSFDDLMNLTSRPVSETSFSFNFSPTAAGTIAAEYALPLTPSLTLPTAATTALLNNMRTGELSSGYETPYEAHPRTRFHSIVLDANGNPYSSSTESRQSAPAGNNPQNNDDKNKQDTTKYNFWRAPLTNGWRLLNSRPGDPMKNINPTYLRTGSEYLGGLLGLGAGYGVYELLDDDNERRPARIETPQNPNNAQTDTRNFDGMNIPIDSLFNLL